MSPFLARIKIKKLPPAIKRWLEEQLNRKILQSEEISISVMKPLTKKERENYRRKWDREKKQRQENLNKVARKMLKAGMSKTDSQVVRDGGWKQ